MSRQIVITQNITVDGVVEATEGWFDPGVEADDGGMLAALLEEGPDGDIGFTGSIDLCHVLLRGGLVDELRLFVHPVVLGRGRRLFPDGVDLRGPTLAGSRCFSTGVTLQTYRIP